MTPLLRELGRIGRQTSDRIGRRRDAHASVRFVCRRIDHNPCNRLNSWGRRNACVLPQDKPTYIPWRFHGFVCHNGCCQSRFRAGKNSADTDCRRVEIANVKQFVTALIVDYDGAQIPSFLCNIINFSADIKSIVPNVTNNDAVSIPNICNNSESISSWCQPEELTEIDYNRIDRAVVWSDETCVAHYQHEFAFSAFETFLTWIGIVCGLKPSNMWRRNGRGRKGEDENGYQNSNNRRHFRVFRRELSKRDADRAKQCQAEET